jgi:hypothetical protein
MFAKIGTNMMHACRRDARGGLAIDFAFISLLPKEGAKPAHGT